MAADGLVGREAELKVLREAVAGLTDGRSAVVLLQGAAGIGKSALLSAAVEIARASGIAVHRGGSDELGTAIPLGPLLEALGCTVNAHDPQRARVASLLLESGAGRPAFGLGGEEWLLGAVLEAVLAVAEADALAGPVMLAMEDLHWADRPTLLALRSMTRRLAHLPFAIVATTRPAPQIADGFARAGAIVIELDELDDEQAAALVEQLTGAPPGPRLMAKVKGAAGNPLFITELVRALTEDGAIQMDGAIAEIDDDELPPTLRQTILQRLATLSEQSLDVLRQASLLGSTFSVEHLAIALGRSGSDVTEVIAEPIASGVLGHAGDRMRFRHDLVRDAIYEDIPFEVRRARHLDVAHLLRDAGVEPAQMVQQWVRGARPDDEEAAEWIIKAGMEVSKTSATGAVELYVKASELLGDDRLHGEHFAVGVVAKYGSGRVDELEPFVRAGLKMQLEPVHELSHRIMLASILGDFYGKPDEAQSEFERALAIEGLPLEQQGRTLATAAGSRMVHADFAAADALSARAIELCLQARTVPERRDELTMFTPGLTLAYTNRAWCAIGNGEAARALQLCDEARDTPGAGELPAQLRGVALAQLDRVEEARALLLQTLEGLIPGDDPGMTQAIIGIGHFRAAQWDEAQPALEVIFEDLALFEGMWRNGTVNAAAHLAMINVHRDDIDAAQRYVERADADLARFGGQWAIDVLELARALVIEARDGAPAAVQRLRDTWEQLDAMRFDHRMQAAEAIRIALAADDRAFAERVLDGIERFAERAGVLASVTGNVRWCRGLVNEDADELLAAAEIMRQTPRALERVLCFEEAARALAAAGRTAEARALFDEALAVYEDIGAARLIARASAFMREHGIRRGARGKRGRPSFGWDALTDTEIQIAIVAANGMRNAEIGERLFISPHTVRTHLRHIYTKLQINTRVELANEVAKHPAPARA